MIFMEEPEVFNFTDGTMPLARRQMSPAAPFPAWLPAVTVAIGMLAFLAGSFYMRHRKVMKKRQILMDYFYIIFQYGGTRRRRMVTALCNTNAITLRDLGRSFMISCESMPGNDGESNCPFYFDDTPYSKPQGNMRRPLTKKYSILKRGFSITRKNRGPFMRFKSQSEENGRQYPYSFQDIVMKLGGRRHHDDPSRGQATKRQALLSPQFEGCSMSTIHGDEMEYEYPSEDRGTSEYYQRQRRNAYVLQYDQNIPRFADVAAEVGRHSLGHASQGWLKQSSHTGKRNSEPWPQQHNQHPRVTGMQPGVFHVQGGLLSPSNVVCGSHGYIPNADPHKDAQQAYRNSEPTILVHSPSIDADDIRSKYTNGVVFLKRISKEDGSPGEFYYEETRTPSVDRPVRTSLSKVSYVPSGNMNQYQNCILIPNKDKPAKDEENKKSKGENISQGMSKSKRGKLNLSSMGVTNFSRRIDLASDSIQDYEPEQSSENKTSSENLHQPRISPSTTWARFKNVFSGSRESQSPSNPTNSPRSLSVNDPQNTRSPREHTHWQRFLSVFTGFRSFPETKHEDEPVSQLKASNSFPVGLNLVGTNCEANFSDINTDTKLLPNDISKQSSLESCKHDTVSAASSCSDNGVESFNGNTGTVTQSERQRPGYLNLQSRTQSFPDDIIHRRQHLQSVHGASDAAALFKSKPFYNRPSQRYGKQSNWAASHASSPLSKSKRDFKSYSFEAGYFSPGGEYRFKRFPTFMDSPHAATPDRLEGNISGSEVSMCPRRFRSLSPLLEINYADSLKGAGQDQMFSNLESVPSHSVYMTPTDKKYHPELQSCDEVLDAEDPAVNNVAFSCPSVQTHLRDFMPISTIVSLSVCDDDDDIDKQVTIEEFKYLDSHIIELDCLSSDNSDTRLETNTIFGSTDKLPQSCFLKPNHKNVSRSSDSVYYDTVSALGSPSAFDSRDMDFAQISPSKSTWGNPDTDCIQVMDIDTSNVVTPSYDAVLSLNVLDEQTLINSDPPRISPENVPVYQQPRCALSDGETSLDLFQCNKLSYTAPLESHTPQAASCTVMENVSRPAAPVIELDSVQSVPRTVNDIHNKAETTPRAARFGRFDSLPVPALTSFSSDNQSISPESSPISSRSSTPTRRHSTPTASPERSPSRQSGCFTPDQIYMANVTRLPRLSQRLGHGGTMPSLCQGKNSHE